MKIYPSLISADLLNLGNIIKTIDEHCDGYHLDVMDNHFVPNLTWGPDFINRIAQATSKQLDIHLMVDNPQAWLARLQLRPHDMITFHFEAMHQSESTTQFLFDIRKAQLNAGIAINPATPVEKVFTHLKDLDHVLLMSVNPGFSGQSFIPDVVTKIQPLVAQRKQMQASALIGMDGGITINNINQLARDGIDYICAASAIFAQNDYVQALNNLYATLQ